MTRWTALVFAAALLSGCAGTDAAPRAPVIVSRAAAQHAETGKASYYGGKFHGRKTASGEVYDKNRLTAAHPRLPFGTMVKVTALRTNKSVVVRINDRFPGTRGRIIDLSEAAFARIAPLSAGVADVRVEPAGR